MRFLRQRFQRLQWRLTLSYTAVTVAALLLVELLFFGGLFYLLRSDWLLNEITTALNESLVAEARYYLAQEPPDEVGLNRWLANSFAEGYTAATEPGDSALSGWPIKLRNQGLGPEDEAYKQQMSGLDMQETDAYNQAMYSASDAGRAEAGQLFGQDAAKRQMYTGERDRQGQF
ncbi:MAG: hypothetical protein R6X32_01755, partial [Chloroflexota bacterium]